MALNWSCGRLAGSTREYANSFFRKSGIHGTSYFANPLLAILEKLLWLSIIIVMFGVLVMLSKQSINRYRYSSTVVTIERDHFYWNITLPSVTICPLSERLNRSLYNEYVHITYPQMSKANTEELFVFLESLANSTYINLKNIKPSPVFDQLNIPSSDYMSLIYNLTEDWTRREGGGINEYKVRTTVDRDYVYSEQVLTEFGICYSSNNYLLKDVAASWQVLGKPAPPVRFDRFYDNKNMFSIVAGNQFDGDVVYTHKGYNVGWIMIHVHSPYEVMDVARKEFIVNQLISFSFLGTMIIADTDFREEMSITQRGCRYSTESNLDHFHVYTKGLCLQQCRLDLAYKLCGCIPHFYPNRVEKPKPVCDYNQLLTCVANYSVPLLQLKDPKTMLGTCKCDQNCEELNVMLESKQPMPNQEDLLGASGAIVSYHNYPMTRYRRKVMFSMEDLLVSAGGTAGLLTGFCVLGAFEIIFFATLRLFYYNKRRENQ